MSKSLGNIFDPWEALDRQGADALRWYMLTNGSPWALAAHRARGPRRGLAPVPADPLERLRVLRHVRERGRLRPGGDAGTRPGRAPPARPVDPLPARPHGGRGPRRARGLRRHGRGTRDPGLRRRPLELVRAAVAAALLGSGRRRGRRRRRGVPHPAHVPGDGRRRSSPRSPRSWPRSSGGTSRPDATAGPTPCIWPTTRSRRTARATTASTPAWPPRARSSASAARSGSRPRRRCASRCPRPWCTSPATARASRRSWTSWPTSST